MSRLKNFLKEDLKKLEKTHEKIDYIIDSRMYVGVQEDTGIKGLLAELEQFISYWQYHHRNIGGKNDE
jgi:hypothetical protein